MGNTIIVKEDWAGLRWVVVQPSSLLKAACYQHQEWLTKRQQEWKETNWIVIEGNKQQFIRLREEWLQLVKQFSKDCSQKIKLIVLDSKHISAEIQDILQSEEWSIDSPQNKFPNLQAIIVDKHVFSFAETANKYDLKKTCDLSKQIFLEQCPSQYLEVNLTDHVLIYHITSNNRKLLFRSPFNEQFNYKIIKKTFAKHQFIKNQHFSKDLAAIYSKGNSNEADLLVEDLCGLDNCASLGLPGKLIASSLAKYFQSKEVAEGEWDQLQSLVQAFAINIGIQIGLQIHLAKVKTVLYRIGHFDHLTFLHAIQSIVSDFGSIWFCPNVLLEIP